MKQNKEQRTFIAIGILYLLTAIYITIKHTVQHNTGYIFMGPVSLLFLLVLPLTERIFRQKLDFHFRVFVLLFCYCAFCLGTALRWYDRVPVYDKLMHLVSGLLFYCVGFMLYSAFSRSRPYRLTDDWVLQMTYAFFFSMAIAVVWEIYEFLCFLLMGHDAQNHLDTGVFDTMYDLIFCFLGTLVPAVFYAIYAKTGRGSVFIHLLESVTPEPKTNLGNENGQRKIRK